LPVLTCFSDGDGFSILALERVVLYSRDGDNDLDLTRHGVYLGTGGAAVKILDLGDGQVRSTTLGDLYQLGRLASIKAF